MFCCHSDRWQKVPKPVRIVVYVLLGLLVAASFALIFGYLTMTLWNAILPTLFSLPEVTFWQAVGLLVLARLFTGSFHRGHCRDHFRHKREQWANGASGCCGPKDEAGDEAAFKDKEWGSRGTQASGDTHG